MKLLMENWRKLLEDTEQERVTLTLPKLRISEQWGEPGSDDRKIIEMFTSKIKGSTFGEKINSVQKLIKDCDERCVEAKDIPEILGSLVFLDCMASLIYDFNDKTGGYLFESILAALLGGKARQVPTGGGRYQDIEDVVDSDDNPMSLKLLFDATGGGAGKKITGSVSNARYAITNYKTPIKYIVGIKNRDHKNGEVLSVNFYSFTVGYGEYEGDFPSSRLRKGLSTYYAITQSDFQKPKFFLGTLDLGSREKIKEIANKYVERLGTTLTNIYKDLDLLSRYANDYFLNAPDSKNSALKAQESAESLSEKTKELK